MITARYNHNQNLQILSPTYSAQRNCQVLIHTGKALWS